MPSTREIRRRIRSVKSTAQITKAMEMVSAVKMRRSQAAVLASRPYAERMEHLLGTLAAHTEADLHPLLRRRPVERIAVLLVTSDRGLCGSLNVNAVRQAAGILLEYPNAASVVTVGRKGRDWMARYGAAVVADVSELGDRPTLLDAAPVARVIIDQYVSGEIDAVDLVYSKYASTTVQRIVRERLLPIEPRPEDGRHFADFIYEPSAEEVLRALLPRYVEMLVYQAILESRASEHSARMVAMHNATENAQEVIEQLTLNYNKARQSGITSEILEIASGAGGLAEG